MSDSKPPNPSTKSEGAYSGPEKAISEQNEKPCKDLIVLQGPTTDQKGYKILRARADRVETGELRPLEEGKPIHGDLVELEQHQDAPFLFDVKQQVSASKPEKQSLPAELASAADEHSSLPALLAKELTKKWQNRQSATPAKKPAKVTSREYRSNWDHIWSAAKDKKSRLN